MAELVLGAAALYLGWKVARKAGSAYRNAKQEMYEERGLADYGDPYGYYADPNIYYGQSQNYYPPQSSHHHHHSGGHYGGSSYYPGNSHHSSHRHSYR